jgi:hypothetical protein
MATECAAWLQRWLDSVASSWPWPVLQQEYIDISLAQGATSLTVGNANGDIAERLLRILDNVWVYTTDKTSRGRVRIRHQLGIPIDRISPTTRIGMPSNARVFKPQAYQWTLYFDPLPDRDYYLTIPAIVLPDAMTDDADVPWYENDETMIQAVAFKVSEYHNGKDSPVTAAFQQALAALVANDRIRFGAIHGVNDVLILSPSVFK